MYSDPLGQVVGEGAAAGALVGGTLGLVTGVSTLIGYDTYAAVTGKPLMTGAQCSKTLGTDVVGGALGGAIVGTVLDPDPIDAFIDAGLGTTGGSMAAATGAGVGAADAAGVGGPASSGNSSSSQGAGKK